MTAERPRAPLRQGAPASVCALDGGAPAPDLFDLAQAAGPHPDFTARAAIWRDHAAGLVSFAEARRRSAAVGASQAHASSPAHARVCATHARPRHARPAPAESRQYAQPMATTAARDDRLTPNAKAFLQVLAARCGKGRETSITKGTAGNIMARSARTIRRYLVDLVRFGYVEVQTRANARGLHLGLTVRITDKARPFFEEAKGLARWLAETPAAAFRPFEAVLSAGKPGVTLPTPRNQNRNHFSSASFGLADTGHRAARGRLWSEAGWKGPPFS